MSHKLMIAFVVLSAVGCAQDEKKPARKAPATQSAPKQTGTPKQTNDGKKPTDPSHMDLVGTWSAGCMVDEVAQASANITYIITATSIKMTVDEYSDAKCLTPKSKSISNGSYKVGSAVSVGVGYQFDIVYNDMQLTYNQDSAVAEANKEEICGKKDWKKNETKKCEGSLNIYTLIMQAGDSIQFGESTDTLDESEPAKRPTKIADHGYAKQ